MTMDYKYGILFLLISLCFSCTSVKSIIASGEVNAKLSAKQIIKENTKHVAEFNTLQSKVKIDYTDNKTSKGVTVNLRIEKDKIIWISAPLGVARTMITPQKVRFYDKWNNQYFDGNYTLLSNLLGVDLDFYKVQNLLLGNAIFNLKNEPYKTSTHDKSYVLQPKQQNALLELFFLVNPGHFKMDSQQLFQQIKRRMLQIDYSAYQDINKQILPKNIRITAVENSEEVNIDMELKSVSLNNELRFPFKIPSGFQEIIIK